MDKARSTFEMEIGLLIQRVLDVLRIVARTDEGSEFPAIKTVLSSVVNVIIVVVSNEWLDVWVEPESGLVCIQFWQNGMVAFISKGGKFVYLLESWCRSNQIKRERYARSGRSVFYANRKLVEVVRSFWVNGELRNINLTNE